MIIAEIVTLLIYIISMAFLPEYFGSSSDSLDLIILTIHRSVICCVYDIRLEGGIDRSRQRFPFGHHQAYP
jgi:hypothetical protein